MSKTTKKPADLRHAALERFAQTLHDVMPVADGPDIIKAGTGYYRVAQREDGVQALLFSFDRAALDGPTLPKDKDVFVVDAQKHATKCPWILHSVMEHQKKMIDASLEDGMLYRVAPGVIVSGSVSYRIYPDSKSPADESGVSQFRIRRYTENGEDNSFADVEDNPDFFTLGTDLGTFSEFECDQAVTRDFLKCLRRMIDGKDPVPPVEMLKHPQEVVARGLQKTSAYLRETHPVKIGKDALEGVLTLINPADWAKAGVNYGIGKIIEELDKDKTPAQKLQEHSEPKTRLGKALPLMKDDERTRFQPVSLKDADVRTVLPKARKGRNEIRDHLRGTLQGGPGALVTLHDDGAITVKHLSGLTLDLVPEKGKAFASLDEKHAAWKGLSLPAQVRTALSGGDVFFDISSGKSRNQKQFQKAMSGLTGNEAWQSPRPSGEFCRISSRQSVTKAPPSNKRRFLGQGGGRGKTKAPKAG